MRRLLSTLLLSAALVTALTSGAWAAEYSFDAEDTTAYYTSTTYERIYGISYHYGGANVCDYQPCELPYGNMTNTQTGIMEKAVLPRLYQAIALDSAGGYGVSSAVPTVVAVSQELASPIAAPSTSSFTKLTEDFKLSNGAVGRVSIPALGIKDFNLWEGETTSSMNKGLGHFTSTSVWDGNVAACGHNRGAKYVIGAIKDLSLGDTITYTTSQGIRTYAVQVVTRISSTDWSYLTATADNRITLITCVAGDPSQRWLVQAVEKT